MPEIKVFENIASETPDELILYRLGYKAGKTQMNEYDRANIEEGISRGKGFCRLKAVFTRLRITGNDLARVTFENGTMLRSAQLAELLMDSQEAVFMGATAGEEITIYRDAEMKTNAALGVVLDAVGSETADYGLEWVTAYINTTLRPEARMLSRRYSPGYGDLELSAQKQLFDALNFGQLGVKITPRFILQPEKSVLAVAGIVNG